MKRKLVFITITILILGFTVSACSKDSATSTKKEETVNKEDKQDEQVSEEYQLEAKVLQIHDEYLMIEALEGQTVAGEVQMWIGLLSENELPELKVGDTIRIPHDGKMTMSLPPQMSAVGSIEIIE